MKTFGKGGIHPPEMKLTSGMGIIDVELPRKVVVSLSQSLGKPAKEAVKAGQHVSRCELIGEADGFVSANVHSPISGTVKSVGPVTGTDGHYVTAVTIEASDEDHMADLQSISDAAPVRNERQIDELSGEEIIKIITEAGIVGLGGATFPTAVKLAPSKTGKAETLLINGSECEPYLTCDEAIMREMSHEIITGIRLLMRACGASKAIIGIENNKPEAIKSMTAAARVDRSIEVVPLKTRYPQGGEKMLCKALTGREIKSGQLPITEGVVIINIATSLAVYHAAVWGLPLIERVMTVSGADMERRGNYRVPIGSSVADLTAMLGGVPASCVRIVNGGTMMGRAMAGADGYTVKGMSGLLFLSERECSTADPEPCVKCGRCVDSCPMGLEPYLIARLSEIGLYEDAKSHDIMDCMECGCCSYSCISRRPLVDWIKVGKTSIRKQKI